MYCGFCGHKLDGKEKYCTACGKYIDYIEKAPNIKGRKFNRKNILVFIVLAVVMIVLVVMISAKDKNEIGSNTQESVNSEWSNPIEEVSLNNSDTNQNTEINSYTEINSNVEMDSNAFLGVSEDEKAYYKYLSDIAMQASEATNEYVVISDEVECEDIYYKEYAIEDFDGDGRTELMIYEEVWEEDMYMEGPCYGTSLSFYRYNETTDSIIELNSVYTECPNEDIFYDNGIVRNNDCYFGVKSNYLNELGILPDVSDSGVLIDEFCGQIIVQCYEGVFSVDLVQDMGVTEFKTVSEEEYNRLVEILNSGNVIHAELYFFDILDIAALNDKYPEEYTAYGGWVE